MLHNLDMRLAPLGRPSLLPFEYDFSISIAVPPCKHCQHSEQLLDIDLQLSHCPLSLQMAWSAITPRSRLWLQDIWNGY